MTSSTGGTFYERLGVKRTINAASWLTRLGGSIMPPPVVQAMEDASRWFVDMDELNKKAGDIIARLTGAEAGLVTAGSAAGMLLEAAACMAGTDPAKRHRLPDTTGMKSEIVIHRAHRVNYDHNFRAAGAILVEIGNSVSTEEWELEDAIGENTAAVAYIFALPHRGELSFPKVVEIARARDVPVIVDAAAMLPPVENLTRFINEGADMVSFSGGKGVMGPQSTGILCGRADLIEAAYLNGQPNSDGIGRSAKVCKEEIAGLITALELFVDTDHQALAAEWRDKSQSVVNALQDLPGLLVELSEAAPELDELYRMSARAMIYFEKSWKGPGRQAVVQKLIDGAPSIQVSAAQNAAGIAVIPVNLADGEEELVASRLREILTGKA